MAVVLLGVLGGLVLRWGAWVRASCVPPMAMGGTQEDEIGLGWLVQGRFD